MIPTEEIKNSAEAKLKAVQRNYDEDIRKILKEADDMVQEQHKKEDLDRIENLRNQLQS